MLSPASYFLITIDRLVTPMSDGTVASDGNESSGDEQLVEDDNYNQDRPLSEEEVQNYTPDVSNVLCVLK